MAKWVYLFKEGNATMRNLLGGKGCNLAEMTQLGMPIPQGFTVTTEACTDYYKNSKQVSEEIKGQIFDALNSSRNPASRNSSALSIRYRSKCMIVQACC